MSGLADQFCQIESVLSIIIFDCPFVLAFKRKTQKEYLTLNEAKRANLKSNKKILNGWPFWNKVYAQVHTLHALFLFI